MGGDRLCGERGTKVAHLGSGSPKVLQGHPMGNTQKLWSGWPHEGWEHVKVGVDIPFGEDTKADEAIYKGGQGQPIGGDTRFGGVIGRKTNVVGESPLERSTQGGWGQLMKKEARGQPMRLWEHVKVGRQRQVGNPQRWTGAAHGRETQRWSGTANEVWQCTKGDRNSLFGKAQS